jgi:hypothetical protein
MSQFDLVTQSKEWAEAIVEDNKKRNVVSITEFEQFLPLYDKTVTNGNVLSVEQIGELVRRLAARVLITYPITLVDNKGEVIKTLPPIMKANLPDVGSSDIGSRILNRYHTMLSEPGAPPHEKQNAQDMFAKLVQASCAQARAEAVKEKNDVLGDELLNRDTDPTGDWSWD